MKKYIKLYDKDGQLLGFQENTSDGTSDGGGEQGQRIIVSAPKLTQEGTYETTYLVMSESLTLEECKEHLQLNLNDGGTVNWASGGSLGSTGLYISSAWIATVQENYIKLKDTTSGHGPKLCDARWV